MTERKVASREERLMFEQIIRQDMQNGIQRTISSTPTAQNSYNQNIPKNNQNQNQIRTPNSNLNYEKENNNNQNMNNQNRINNEPKRTLAQKFNIRTNKGKRDAVWEQKRRIKIAKYEQIMQEEQQYYKQQGSPRMTPQNMNNANNINDNNNQYQRNTPNNQQRITPQQQYQRNTPNNQQRMTPQQEYQRGMSNDPRDQYEYQNNIQNQNQNQMRMSPKQYNQYENGNPEMDPRLNYNRSPPYNAQRNPNSPYNNNYNMRNSPYNDNYPMRTPQPHYNQNRDYDYNMRGSRTPFIDYKTGQNVYSKRGFTPGQNHYNEIPNRPPSRPFGDISFKGQQNGGENYQRYNQQNQNNYY